MRRCSFKHLAVAATLAMLAQGAAGQTPVDSVDFDGDNPVICVMPPHDPAEDEPEPFCVIPPFDPAEDEADEETAVPASEAGSSGRWGKFLKTLIPSHVKTQFYGGIGLVSVGCGWDYGRSKQWETDFLIGIVPKYNSSAAKLSFTLKETFEPWSIGLGGGFSMRPLTCGLYLNAITGDEFWTRQPSRYPSGYYFFSTRIRTHIFMGENFTYTIPRGGWHAIKAVTAFYELSSNDLYLISAYSNHLNVTDYIKLSFGLKLQLR